MQDAARLGVSDGGRGTEDRSPEFRGWPTILMFSLPGVFFAKREDGLYEAWVDDEEGDFVGVFRLYTGTDGSFNLFRAD